MKSNSNLNSKSVDHELEYKEVQAEFRRRTRNCGRDIVQKEIYIYKEEQV